MGFKRRHVNKYFQTVLYAIAVHKKQWIAVLEQLQWKLKTKLKTKFNKPDNTTKVYLKY